MKITLDIEDNDGTHIYHTETLSIDGAVQDLYRFERLQKKTEL